MAPAGRGAAVASEGWTLPQRPGPSAAFLQPAYQEMGGATDLFSDELLICLERSRMSLTCGCLVGKGLCNSLCHLIVLDFPHV